MNYFFIATRNLLHRKLRSLLTIIGIFIGIAAVVALVSLSTGLNNVVNSEFQKLGSDKVIIMPGDMMMMGPGMSAKPLTDDDARAIKTVNGVKLVGSILLKVALVEFSGERKSAYTMGIPPDGPTLKMLEDSEGVELDQGRNFKPSDKYKVALGAALADGKSVFKKKIRIGNKITINGKEFEVIAILTSAGAASRDKAVYMPLDAAREVFGEPTAVTEMVAQAEPGVDPNKLGDAIKKKLRQRRGEKEGEESFSVQTPEQLQATFGSILLVIQIVIIGIAAISLLVGGIGIMNTMYTSVLERTREIGIMKAVGARNRDVWLIFLTESGLLGLVGGLVGVSIGVGIAVVAEMAAAQAGVSIFKANLAPELIVGALAFSFFVGAFSGFLPARQAASLKPADALRYE